MTKNQRDRFFQITAKLLKKAIVALLQIIKLNRLSEKVGIEKFLKEGGLKKTDVDLIGSLFYWIIMLTVILAVFNSLKLTSAQEIITNAFILVFGAICLAFGLGGKEKAAEILKNIKTKKETK